MPLNSCLMLNFSFLGRKVTSACRVNSPPGRSREEEVNVNTLASDELWHAVPSLPTPVLGWGNVRRIQLESVSRERSCLAKSFTVITTSARVCVRASENYLLFYYKVIQAGKIIRIWKFIRFNAILCYLIFPHRWGWSHSWSLAVPERMPTRSPQQVRWEAAGRVPVLLGCHWWPRKSGHRSPPHTSGGRYRWTPQGKQSCPRTLFRKVCHLSSVAFLRKMKTVFKKKASKLQNFFFFFNLLCTWALKGKWRFS